MQKNIVVIGGGTGTFVALTGLKKHTDRLSAVVTTMDSGGSSGRLRDELGVLPPGDIRQCLVALSTSSEQMRSLFNYRYTEGSLKGHTFGNIFLSTLEKSSGSLKEAIKEVGNILRIKGKVVPVTFDKTDLCVELENGDQIVGETHIDTWESPIERAHIRRAYLKTPATVNQDAVRAIQSADIILIGPGDLYTSIVPNLLVSGISEAIQKSQARKIFVMNIMTKNGQTTHYTAQNHIRDVEEYLGEGVIDTVLVNTTKPQDETLSWYMNHNEEPVRDDLNENGAFKIVRTDLLKDVILPKQEEGDELRRSIIRHDPEKLANAVLET